MTLPFGLGGGLPPYDPAGGGLGSGTDLGSGTGSEADHAARTAALRASVQNGLDAYLRRSLGVGGFQGAPAFFPFGGLFQGRGYNGGAGRSGNHGFNPGGGNPGGGNGGNGGNGGGGNPGGGNGGGNNPPPNPQDWPLNLLYPPPIGTGAQWRYTMKYGA